MTSVPAGIDCVTDCAQHFGSGSVVTLTATPRQGLRASTGWGGACAGTAPTCTVTMGADRGRDGDVRGPRRRPRRRPPPVAARRRSPPARGEAQQAAALAAHAAHEARHGEPQPLAAGDADRHDAGGARRAPQRLALRQADQPACATARAARATCRCTGARTLRGSGTVHVHARSAASSSPARYRLAIIALDASGNRVGPSTITFTVKK